MIPGTAEKDCLINILPAISPRIRHTSLQNQNEKNENEASTETKSKQKYRYLQHLGAPNEKPLFGNTPRTRHP